MGIFLRCSRAANATVQGLSWPNFKPIQAFIVNLISSKNEEDTIKNEGTSVVKTLFIAFSDAQGQLALKSVMESCQTHPSFYDWSCYLQE